MWQLINQTSNCAWLFYYFNFERRYDVLKSKSPCILLNKNINFNKNEKELKMENPTPSFRETNLVLQLIQESETKSKTVMTWSLQKKKEDIFCTIYFLRFVFYLNVLSTEYTFRIYILLHIKKHYFILLLAFKIVKRLQSILNLKSDLTLGIVWYIFRTLSIIINSDILRYILVLFRHIQPYYGIFSTQCNSYIFRSSNKGTSSSAHKNTRVLLVPCCTWKWVPTAISGGMNISEDPRCHLLQ